MQLFSKLVKLIFAVTLLLLLNSNSNATLYNINVPINSSQQVPPNASTGTGTLTGTYNDVSNVLNFSVTYSGLSGNTTAAHFHGPAAFGTNAAVRIGWTGFVTGVTSGNYSNTFVLTAAQESEMLGSLWYANIHSTIYGGGEIRGQVYATPVAVLELTALIEGLYDNANNVSVRDTLTVNLRQGTSPYNPVESQKIFMKSIGNDTVKYLTGVNGTDYFLQLEHRNAVETWSAAPLMFSGYYSSYDFSTSGSQAYGSNQVLKGVRYCLYSGDVNSDGAVDIVDLTEIDNDAFNSVFGYVNTDLNGDDVVDVVDLTNCDNNVFYSIAAVIP